MALVQIVIPPSTTTLKRRVWVCPQTLQTSCKFPTGPYATSDRPNSRKPLKTRDLYC